MRGQPSLPRIVHWLRLAKGSSFVTTRGLPAVAPAVAHSPDISPILSAANSMLADLLEDVEHSVETHHDCDWSAFPDVGAALRAAGAEEQCLCLAVCPSRGLWGAGLGGKWKSRETSSKLALCVALAWHAESFSDLAARWPDLGSLCEAAGYKRTDGGSSPPLALIMKRKEPEPDLAQAGLDHLQQAAAMRPLVDTFVREGAQPPAKRHAGMGAYDCQTPVKLEADCEMTGALWIQLNDMPFALRGLCSEGPAVNLGWDHKFNALQSTAHTLLEDLVGNDLAAQVQFHHDCDWSLFPQIGRALAIAGDGEHSVCVAICPELQMWGVGLGGKWKTRQTCSKLALCIAVGVRQPQHSSMPQWPDFRQICQELCSANGRVACVPAGEFAPKVELDLGTRDAPRACQVRQPRAFPPPAREDDRAPRAFPPPAREFGHFPRAYPPPARDDRTHPFPPCPPAVWEQEQASPRAFPPPAREWLPARESAPVADERTLPAMPRDTPLWIQMPAECPMPSVLETCPRMTMVVSTAGSARSSLFSNADKVVAHLVGNSDRDVEYVDDPGRDKFPGIGAELRKLGERPEAMGIAFCASRDVWGIGVGGKQACRYQAAKVSLAVMLILQAEELGEDADIAGFPDIADFAEESRRVRRVAFPDSVPQGDSRGHAWGAKEEKFRVSEKGGHEH